MQQGLFREDLYYRLKVFPINIPTLKQRKSDIPSLVHHFIEKKATQMKLLNIPKITAEGMDHLVAYDWPGNVRELENAVERALILANNQPLSFTEFAHLTPVQSAPSIKSMNSSQPQPESLDLDSAMASHIQKAMSLALGKVEGAGGAAELLGINPRTLRYRMRKLGVPFGRKAMAHYQKGYEEMK